MSHNKQVWITGHCIRQTRRGVTLRVLDRTNRTRDVNIARVHITNERSNSCEYDFLVPQWVAFQNKLNYRES